MLVTEHVTLLLKPDPDLPADLPFRAQRVDVPLHPLAHAAGADAFWAMGFPIVAYRSTADPMSYTISVEMGDAVGWYHDLLAGLGYSCRMISGRHGNMSTGVYTDWRVLDVSPPDNPTLVVQLTFRPVDGEKTAVTYRAEEHPIPFRDPDSLLSLTTERIEVHYTFLNGPERTVDRTVTDTAAIRVLVEAINTLSPDNRSVILGAAAGGWADLRCFIPGGEERIIHVDAAARIVVVDAFPALQGDLWPLLIQTAPLPKGAGEIT